MSLPGPSRPIPHLDLTSAFGAKRKSGSGAELLPSSKMTQHRHPLHKVGKRLHPGSLSQKQINLFRKPSSGGIVLQKEVISPGKRYETSIGDPGRHLTARIDRDHKVVT